MLYACLVVVLVGACILKSDTLSDDEAEMVALQALAFLASDEARLGRFLSLTGVTPSELHARAGMRDIQLATLVHLMGNESELLVFANEAHVPPEHVVEAHKQLGGEPGQ